MNKTTIHKTKYQLLVKRKVSIKKEYLLQGNSFLVANGCYRFVYTISSVCIVFLDLVEYSQ